MDAKERVKKLFYRMLCHYNEKNGKQIQRQSTAKAKECTLILIEELMSNCFEQHHWEYWNEVKQQAHKL